MLETHGVAFVARASGCEYLNRAVLYDEVAVRMWFSEVRERSFRMAFDVTRQLDGALLATGFNALVTVDAAGRAVPVPPALREHILQP